MPPATTSPSRAAARGLSPGRTLVFFASLCLGPTHFSGRSKPLGAVWGGGGGAEAQLLGAQGNAVGADYAVRVSGGAQYLEVVPGVDLVDKSFSLEIWVKRARGAAEEVLISQGTGATGRGLQFGFLRDDKVRFSFWGDGDCDNVYNAFDAGSGAVVEQWTHWAATYEAGRTSARGAPKNQPTRAERGPRAALTVTIPSSISSCAPYHLRDLPPHLFYTHERAAVSHPVRQARRKGTPHHMQGKIFRDGNLVAACTKPRHFTGTGPLFVGRSFDISAGNSLRGDVSEVRVWTGVALQRRMLRAYAPFTNTTITDWHPWRTHLAGYWTLDGNTGSKGVDRSGRSVSIDLVNGARWVTGMAREKVPVKDIRLSLNHDESAVDLRGFSLPYFHPIRNLYEYYVAPGATRRRYALRRMLLSLGSSTSWSRIRPRRVPRRVGSADQDG